MKTLQIIKLLPILLVSSFHYGCAEKADAQSQTGRPPTTLNDEMRTISDYEVVLQVPNLGANQNSITSGVEGVLLSTPPWAVDGGHIQTTDAGFVADMGITADAGFTDAGNAMDATALDAGALDSTFTDTDGGHLATSDGGWRPPPYPCKVQAVIKDDPDLGVSGTISCTGTIRIAGRDQFGFNRDESITTNLTESGAGVVKSQHVYEEVTYFYSDGCSNFRPEDKLQVSCAQEIGLPFRLMSGAGIRSLCIVDQVETSNVNTAPTYCYSSGQLTYDGDDYSVNLVNISGDPDAGADGGPGLSTGDRVKVTVRTPNGI